MKVVLESRGGKESRDLQSSGPGVVITAMNSLQLCLPGTDPEDPAPRRRGLQRWFPRREMHSFLKAVAPVRVHGGCSTPVRKRIEDMELAGEVWESWEEEMKSL